MPIMFVMLIQLAVAIETCEYKEDITEACTILTPILTGCSSYNYSVIDVNGTAVSSSLLTSIGDDQYKFTLNESEGDYIIKLCSGATREVKVRGKDENNMIIAAIILIPMLLGFFLLIGATGLGDDHVELRLFLFLLSPVMFIVSLHFGVVALVKFYNFPELENTVGATVYWFSLILGGIVSYFFLYILIKIIHSVMEKKKDRLEY